MRGAFRKILTSGSSLFSFTSQNPLLGVVQQAVPTIETQQVDSRKVRPSKIVLTCRIWSVS